MSEFQHAFVSFFSRKLSDKTLASDTDGRTYTKWAFDRNGSIADFVCTTLSSLHNVYQLPTCELPMNVSPSCFHTNKWLPNDLVCEQHMELPNKIDSINLKQPTSGLLDMWRNCPNKHSQVYLPVSKINALGVRTITFAMHESESHQAWWPLAISSDGYGLTDTMLVA